MGDVTIPARSHSHGSAKAKPVSAKGKNGPIGYVKVNESVWAAVREVLHLSIAGRDFRTVDVYGPGKVEISNYGGT